MFTLRNQRGFGLLSLIFIIGIIGITGLVLFLSAPRNMSLTTPLQTSTNSPTQPPSKSQNWSTFSLSKYSFRILYPGNWFNRNVNLQDFPILSYSQTSTDETIIPLDTITFELQSNVWYNSDLWINNNEMFQFLMSQTNGYAFEVEDQKIKLTIIDNIKINNQTYVQLKVEAGSKSLSIVNREEFITVSNNKAFVIINNIAATNAEYINAQNIIRSVSISDF